jgi:cytochrome b561
MTHTHFDALTRSLHWLIALLVVAAYAIALGREALPKGDVRTALLALHMSLGLTILLLMAVRLAWRIAAPRIAPIPMAPTMQLASRIAHIGLYALLVAVPLVGMVATWMKGRTVGFFGYPLASPFAANPTTGKLFAEAHELVGTGLMALAGLHAVAGLAHHYILKDDTLRRMMPQLGNGRA